jgi:type III pantothenate kinase
MNIVVDDGNTRTKLATFSGSKDELSSHVFESENELQAFLQNHTFENAVVSSVRGRAGDLLGWIAATGKKISLAPSISMPLQIKYSTPATLGVDRIAAAVGAQQLFPKTNCLVIDAGTCITYEFVTGQGEYMGGGISPGVRMRFEAMHRLTAKLPLAPAIKDAPLIGATTAECLQSGVMNGASEEIKGIISRYRSQFNSLQVVLCGGDAGFFENILKPSIFVAPNLVLHGLRGILIHHVSA